PSSRALVASSLAGGVHRHTFAGRVLRLAGDAAAGGADPGGGAARPRFRPDRASRSDRGASEPPEQGAVRRRLARDGAGSRDAFLSVVEANRHDVGAVARRTLRSAHVEALPRDLGAFSRGSRGSRPAWLSQPAARAPRRGRAVVRRGAQAPGSAPGGLPR